MLKHTIVLIILALAISLFVSSSNLFLEPVVEPDDQAATWSLTLFIDMDPLAAIRMGERITLRARFEDQTVGEVMYTWEVGNEKIVRLGPCKCPEIVYKVTTAGNKRVWVAAVDEEIQGGSSNLYLEYRNKPFRGWLNSAKQGRPS